MNVKLSTNFETEINGNSLILKGALLIDGASHSIYFEKLGEGSEWDTSQLEKIREIYARAACFNEVTYRKKPEICSEVRVLDPMRQISSLLFKRVDPPQPLKPQRSRRVTSLEQVYRQLDREATKFAETHSRLFLSELSYKSSAVFSDRAYRALDRLLDNRMPPSKGDALKLWLWLQQMMGSILELCHQNRASAAFYTANLLPLCLGKNTTPLREALERHA